jgi:hypothetical protein
VFKLQHVSKQRIEELRTYCLGKFWTPETFFDWLAVEQKKDPRKISLATFILDRIAQIVFLTNAGFTQQASPEKMINQFKVFVKAMADPQVEERTRKIGMHQVIDLSRFLNILGPQTIQLTIRYRNNPLTSYILKTTRKTVEYIRIIPGKQDKATINFDINLTIDNFNGQNGSPLKIIKNSIQTYMYHIVKPLTKGNIQKTRNILKFTLAASIEVISTVMSQIL